MKPAEKQTEHAVPSESPEDWDPEALDHDDRLILWMLEQPPARRLEVLQDYVEGVVWLQSARKIG